MGPDTVNTPAVPVNDRQSGIAHPDITVPQGVTFTTIDDPQFMTSTTTAAVCPSLMTNGLTNTVAERQPARACAPVNITRTAAAKAACPSRITDVRQ